MKYSYQWLQKHIKEQLPPVEKLKEEIIFHAFEVESVETVGDDAVLDIKVLPDRAGDCLSHFGMAREIAGLLGLTLNASPSDALPATPPALPVELQTDTCARYLAVRIDGVNVGPSPEWLQRALEALGQRSVNNVVDATNFVLLDSGQPVHAFDAAKIDGGIVVRAAHEGETIKLLGGAEKTLHASDTVIADYLGALAIAGVKGGATAEVGEQTTSIVVEVASFDAVSIRRTSRRLALITDASKRFENGLSSLALLPAAQQVVALIVQVAGGAVAGVSDVGTAAPQERTIECSLADITRVLGDSITEADIERVLGRYHYAYSKKGDAYLLSVPHWRADMEGAHDVAEEVGRVVGYDKIPAAPALPFVPHPEPNEIDMLVRAARGWCVDHGYREVRGYAFGAQGEVEVLAGAKGKELLRSQLSSGMKDRYELNRRNAPLLGIDDVKLFEIGTAFLKDREELRVALCDKGTIQELPLAAFIKEQGIDASVESEKVAEELSASSAAPAPFKPWSPYPFVTRDMAAWLDTAEAKAKLVEAANAFALKHCARPPQLFDEFQKEGRTSVAYRFVFQADDHTLTDEEVAARWEPFLQSVRDTAGAEVR